MAAPLISVVIPAYNAAAYLGAAVESVLAESTGNIEVVVVDDGSTDNTSGVASEYSSRIRYIRQANKGIAGARNRGIAESCGTLVGLLDADDTWLPGKVAKQLSALAANNGARVCYSACVITDRDLKPIVVEQS